MKEYIEPTLNMPHNGKVCGCVYKQLEIWNCVTWMMFSMIGGTKFDNLHILNTQKANIQQVGVTHA